MPTASSLQSHITPYHIANVTLGVSDIVNVSKFYQDIMGLTLLASDQTHHDLGCESSVLLRLVDMPDAALRARGSSGLFHTAFLVPTRAHLADWLKHAIAASVSIDGMADHGVSEAIYLHDPEGNGIEIYVDRPRSDWRVINGQVQMGNARLDIEGLLALASTPGPTPFRLAAGSRIGHVHLDVPALDTADAFFHGVWGMDRMFALQGAHFFANGGYHHHIAANVWNTRQAARQTGAVLGLQEVTIQARDAIERAVLQEKWISSTETGPIRPNTIVSPWGLPFSLL